MGILSRLLFVRRLRRCVDGGGPVRDVEGTVVVVIVDVGETVCCGNWG